LEDLLQIAGQSYQRLQTKDHPSVGVGVEPRKVIRYLPLVEKALRICENDEPPKDVLVLNRGIDEDAMRGLDHRFTNWKSEIDTVKKAGRFFVQPEEMKSTDLLYLLYTSGSTGTVYFLDLTLSRNSKWRC
jgi:acyl-coenzyme A synthetase/AMP-(fatty) acid ligase